MRFYVTGMTQLQDTPNIDKQPDNNVKPLQKTKQVSKQKGMGAQDGSVAFVGK